MRWSRSTYPPIPTTMEQLYDLYGDPRSLLDRGANHTTVAAEWEPHRFELAHLPFAVKYHTTPIKQIYCHRLIVPVIENTFELIERLGLCSAITSFDGCYNFRNKTSGKGLSLHAWGLAMDLNANTNWYGTVGDQPAELVELCEREGWTWGGRWPTPDPMHFQWAKGL